MTFFWLAILVLILFGVLNLIVGVSNDAVNFLHAAIGAKVAKRQTIYWIASLGLIMGTFISEGMMEVARKGVIYPENFFLAELLAVFMAVMLTNVILIDAFNTLKFPTSTTVAVVFELLGGAMAMSLIKQGTTSMEDIRIDQIINTDRTFIILSGIVVSILLAFVFGILVQFVARLFFTFNYKNKYNIFFSIIGGAAITAISFMIFKKSIDGILFQEASWHAILEKYLPDILITIFAGSTFVFLFLSLSFNFDIARLVVFFGTFALALSFAANDLVNFIGIPLASLESIQQFAASGAISAESFSLGFLSNDLIQHETLKGLTQFLIFGFSAITMVVTLFMSRKLRGVTETEVFLGRQSVGHEFFEPSHLSRVIVRVFFNFHASVIRILPHAVVRFLDRRYEHLSSAEASHPSSGRISFDTLRAMVNLVVASLLISIGTYLKFPLSTTFVVFMVAMGTSLADQAWGRESAVYRISGVISVLGGWFFTAILAFVGGFIFTFIIWYGKGWSVLPLIAFLGYVLYKTSKYYKQKEAEQFLLHEAEKNVAIPTIDWILETAGDRIKRHLIEASKVYFLSIQAFIDENIQQIHEARNKAELLEKLTRSTKSELFVAYTRLPDDKLDMGHLFIQALDYLSELASCMRNISQPLYKHLENQHKGLSKAQKDELNDLLEQTSSFFNYFIHLEKEQRFDLVPELIKKQSFLLSFLEAMRIKQLKRIKEGEGKTRSNLLFMEILAETKSWLLYSINLLKAHRDFASYCE